uniref:Uncharacterized protein n=1 Tax=Chromera velia CCMP2878 TaxID=1169474 RepID=A0A0G4GCX4_9ALVE|eukprot:Cvel_21350.t1-p1 / transcript=Cvel_21350.t1 / gene=Cvel_21350 / organism=Chromera_velia_CCMP2878 / gene_product=hypothetical protein / transcript_product=hypothetical protein / location=Cvel_scaffold1994:2950-6135(-) / protein_length=720 / sequence_SO=supercontig / SO=protein_coding / is_pseudo=false
MNRGRRLTLLTSLLWCFALLGFEQRGSRRFAHVAAATDFCAGVDGGSCSLEPVAVEVSEEATVTSVVEEEHTDVIVQEIREINKLIELQQRKVVLLEHLRTSLTDGTLQGVSPENKRLLLEKIPDLSALPDERQASASPEGRMDDFLMRRGTIPPPEGKFIDMRWLPVRPKPSGSRTAEDGPPALLVVLSDDGAGGVLSVWLPSGVLVHEFSLGLAGAPLKMALSPSLDDQVIVTLDTSGAVRLFSVRVRPPRRGGSPPPREKEEKGEGESSLQRESAKMRSGFGLPNVNVTAEWMWGQQKEKGGEEQNSPEKEKGKEADGSGISGLVDPLEVTSLQIVQSRGVKTIVLGDSLGGLTVITRGGEVRGRVKVTDEEGGVRGLFAQPSNLYFRTKTSVALFAPSAMEVAGTPCAPGWPSPPSAMSATIGAGQKIIVGLEDGTTVVYEGGKEKGCRLAFKLTSARGDGQTSVFTDLFPLRGYVFGFSTLGDGSSEMTAWNVTSDGGGVLFKQKFSYGSWAPFRRPGVAGLVALREEGKGGVPEGSLVVFETVLPPPGGKAGGPFDFFSNVRIPMILVAVVVLGLFHFNKQRKQRGAMEGEAAERMMRSGRDRPGIGRGKYDFEEEGAGGSLGHTGSALSSAFPSHGHGHGGFKKSSGGGFGSGGGAPKCPFAALAQQQKRMAELSSGLNSIGEQLGGIGEVDDEDDDDDDLDVGSSPAAAAAR